VGEPFARVYTPTVFMVAILTASVPPLLFHQPWETWFYQSLVLLVIGCPCALVISTPVSIVAGLAAAAHNGVLVKGGLALETRARLKAIAIDKTGTLTEGIPSVAKVVSLNGHTEQELLERAGALEASSQHPLARAICDYVPARGFTPEALTAAVRDERGLQANPVPPVCVLEFDGDLTDWLVSTVIVQPCRDWACFHTTMYVLEVDSFPCGIVPRTIGGPYAVLIAEQLAASGARIVLGLTSAGRVSSLLPLPSLVVASQAIRDEGTSYHYLPPEPIVESRPDVVEDLLSEMRTIGLPVSAGLVWTTDAPYRETPQQLKQHSQAGALAVEMQAASLFAFGAARGFPVGVIAHVTNAVGHTEEQFDKGDAQLGYEILKAICRAGRRTLTSLKRG
jgi:uridine phosphorylase